VNPAHAEAATTPETNDRLPRNKRCINLISNDLQILFRWQNRTLPLSASLSSSPTRAGNCAPLAIHNEEHQHSSCGANIWRRGANNHGLERKTPMGSRNEFMHKRSTKSKSKIATFDFRCLW
jgi:hypothetical protein